MTTVLYIEESMAERGRLNQKLVQHGYTVLNANGASEAEQMLEALCIDYVLVGNWGSERASAALAEYLSLLPIEAPVLLLPPLLSLLHGILSD